MSCSCKTQNNFVPVFLNEWIAIFEYSNTSTAIMLEYLIRLATLRYWNIYSQNDEHCRRLEFWMVLRHAGHSADSGYFARCSIRSPVNSVHVLYVRVMYSKVVEMARRNSRTILGKANRRRRHNRLR